MQLDQFDRMAASAQGGDQRGHQSRFAAAVRADDLAEPAVLFQTHEKRFATCVRGKKIGNRPGADVPRGKGVARKERVRQVAHGVVAFRAGTEPNWNAFSPTTSRPRARNTRTRTHQRIFTIRPS